MAKEIRFAYSITKGNHYHGFAYIHEYNCAGLPKETTFNHTAVHTVGDSADDCEQDALRYMREQFQRDEIEWEDLPIKRLGRRPESIIGACGSLNATVTA